MTVEGAGRKPRVTIPPKPKADAPPPEAPASGDAPKGWSAGGGGQPARADGFEAAPTGAAAGTRPPVAAGAYDLATVTKDQIATLMKGTPDEKRLGATLARCQKNYAGLISSGARVVVNAPAGNGGQPVVTLIPPGFNPALPARVHTHYHGWNSSIAEPPGHAAGVTKNLTTSMAANPQTIFVQPECGNVPATSTTPTFHTNWSNVQNITSTVDDSLAAAGYGKLDVRERVVSAHSGGGLALGYAMKNTPDGSGIKADRIELEDCMYGAPPGISSRDALEAWAKTPNGQQLKSVVYYEGSGGNDAKPDAAFKKAFAGRYSHADGYEHNQACAKTLDKTPPAPQ